MDVASLIGLFLGIFAIVGGALLEGLHLNSISQPTAAMIVLGGTFGATFLAFPLHVLLSAFAKFKIVILQPKNDLSALINEITSFAQKARKEGLISLESRVESASDPFLKKAISLAADGTDAKILRETMEVELAKIEHEGEEEAKVYEAMGGFAPTIGILGAVLGLIHVMGNLNDPSKLGSGIAVAFVATVYGVGSANLLFLPIGTKLRARLKTTMLAKELILEGVVGMVEGLNPRVIQERLKGYLPEGEKEKVGAKSSEKASMAA